MVASYIGSAFFSCVSRWQKRFLYGGLGTGPRPPEALGKRPCFREYVMIQLKHAQATRILVIESQEETRELLEGVLREEGFTVLPSIQDPELLLKQLPLYRPNLMVMSLDLDGVDAIELAKKAQGVCAAALIYVGTHLEEDALHRINETNPIGLIMKPLDRERIISSIGVALYKTYSDGVLKAQEALLESTLSSIPDGVLTLNRNKRIRYLNRGAEKLLKKEHKHLIGKNVYDVLHLRNRKTQQRVMDLENWLPVGGAHRGSPVTLELIQAPDCIRLVETLVTHTHDTNGIPDGVVIVLRDVHEQFLAQETISMMAGALENQADAVMVARATKDTQERPPVVYVNKAFEELTGWSRREALSKKIGFLSLMNKESHKVLEEILLALSQGKPYQGEHILHKKDGSRFVAQQVASPVLDESQKPSLYTFALRDVTELRQFEARVRSTQRLEAIGRLAGGFAHDFNNLLSIMTSYADLLKIRLQEQPETVGYLGNIQEACTRAETLVSQLMAFSQRDTKVRHWLNLSQLSLDSKPILERMLPSQLKLVLDIDPDLPSIEANRSEVEQSLLNLAQNAAEAMSGKQGTLTLRTYFCAQDNLPTGLPKGTYACLEVTDTGCGISPELQERIFEPFSSTKEVGTGAGLGLAYVYGVVTQAHGHVLVNSSPSKGAQFSLFFPTG